MNFANILGCIASLFAILAFIFTNMRKIRIMSVIAGILYLVYGFMLSLFPIILLNVACISINVYHLIKEKGE